MHPKLQSNQKLYFKLEEDFKEYVKMQVCQTKDYDKKADKLLLQIINYDKEPRQQMFSLLNFNYTKPLINHNSSWENFVNIHGDINSKIIFGIDGTDCIENPIMFPFTKTVRVATREDIQKKDYLIGREKTLKK